MNYQAKSIANKIIRPFYVFLLVSLVSKDLPEPTGTLISVLAANPKVAGEFYAVNNCGIFCSTDSGISWNVIDGIQWPKEYLSQHPRALAIKEDR